MALAMAVFHHGRGVRLSLGADNLSYVLFSRGKCLTLEGGDLLNSIFCQLKHLIKLFSIKRGAFSSALHETGPESMMMKMTTATTTTAHARLWVYL